MTSVKPLTASDRYTDVQAQRREFGRALRPVDVELLGDQVGAPVSVPWPMSKQAMRMVSSGFITTQPSISHEPSSARTISGPNGSLMPSVSPGGACEPRSPTNCSFFAVPGSERLAPRHSRQ